MKQDKIKCPDCLTEQTCQLNINTNDRRNFKGKCINCSSIIRFKLNDSDENGILEDESISFTINGVEYQVDNSYAFTTTLNEYLREVLKMTGTKLVCKEGGCGSCTVNAEIYDYDLDQFVNVSLNSCLFPLYSCNNMKITTIEGLGNKSTGYNDIQKRLIENNGSQCGFCTPGMVMNMYNFLLNNPKPNKSEIESCMDGNLCRCTGYRGILDAWQSFSADKKPIDIEELHKLKCLNDSKKECKSLKKKIHIIKDGIEWYYPKTLTDLYDLFAQYGNQPYRIVSGGTGDGVYKTDGPFSVYINIRNITDLYKIVKVPILQVGSMTTIEKLINVCNSYSSNSGFEYLSVLTAHWLRIANRHVRSIGTWAGNIMMKYYHHGFSSDLFLTLETVNATITIIGPDKITPPEQLKASELLSQPKLNGKILYSLNFQPFDSTTNLIKTYKVSMRSQNSHAYVNAGFKFEIDNLSNLLVKSLPNIVFGGISGTFIHAINTEKYLLGQKLSNPDTFKNALKILYNEIPPDPHPVLSDPQYRKNLACALFYKFILYANKNNIVNKRLTSATDNLIDCRQVSTGIENYSSNPSMYPVSKPMTKTNALQQASGEAQYVYDMAINQNELNGVFIVSTLANCKIDSIDITKALQMPGVCKILLAKDIPGINTFMPNLGPLAYETLFAFDQIDYAGQPLGLVVAETYDQAYNASKSVLVSYKEMQKPILSIQDAIKANSFFPSIPTFTYGNADQAIANAKNKISGTLSLGTQFHFYLENQIAIASPTDDGFEIYSSTQYIDLVQRVVSIVLGINASKVNVLVKQLGGAYGGKITRANITAAAAAIASNATNKKVRVLLDLNMGLEMIGKRVPWTAEYTIGFDDYGKLLGQKITLYADCGNSPNDCDLSVASGFIDNTYSCSNLEISFKLAKTNLPANTAARSPGFFPSIAIAETIIEHVAKSLILNPLSIRRLNLYNQGDVTPAGQPLPYFNVSYLMDEILKSSDYATRSQDIETFNQQNRWKKRGISLTPIKWGAGWTGAFYNIIVSVFAIDGSVSLFHSGVECGQGIHTKAAQVCAYKLGIPIEMISVKYANNLISPNSQCTGGSITSELIADGVIECCNILNKSLDPIREQNPGKTWPELINIAFQQGVDLTSHYLVFPTDKTPFRYNVYGVCVSEAIIDVLTGELQISRVDMLYDCGQSLNGEIDVGQAQGAFMMGLGFWLLEKVKYDPKTGKLLTNGTWEYKPPFSKDLPIDFRISFLNNNPNVLGILGSKCVGEPPLCLTPSVAFAVKRAIEAAQLEIKQNSYFSFDAPTTVESVQQLCLLDINQFELN